jgi:hypothetical protein
VNTLSSNLEQILCDLRPAAERRAAQARGRRRVRRIGLVGLSVAGLAGSAAVAAVQLLGAPDSVKRDFLAVDEGMPADLRLNPDVEHARRVAVSGDAAVYFAPLADGGYCAELVSGGRGRGAVCSTREQTDHSAIGVTVPFTDPVRDTSPVTVSGRVGPAAATTIRLVYPDHATDDVAISSDRFYLASVPPEHLRAVHHGGLMLLAVDRDERSLAEAVVPFDAITPPTEAQRPKDPIEVDTISDHRDFTLLLGVRGTVSADGHPTRVRLVFPDGSAITAPLRDGAYFVHVPADRRHDFARAPGAVQALDAEGEVVAERAVASVAYWRARNGG